MANMTLAIPDEIQAEMKRFPEIRWSEVARKAILEKIERLETIEKIARKSKLTKKDIDEFDTMIKKEATKRALLN
ncbi:MAG: hypothetical protein AABW88_05655 [Nanoarchaeota archaeon]